ncbi:hypothetical protein GW916_10470 [bacterium]|nr:hypothetical protein [bacterium]
MNEVVKDIFQGGEYSLNKNLSSLLTNEAVYVEFWISRSSIGGTIKQNLCYGLISEAKVDVFSEWRNSDFKSVLSGAKKSDKLRYKVAKLSSISSGKKIARLFDELLQGKDLKTACENTDLPVPNEKFHSIKLVHTKKNDRYAFRPPITALPSNILDTLMEGRQGYSSPIQNTIATVGSLYLLDKEELWRDAEGNILPSARDIIRGLTQYLASQTGLKFNQSDLKRIGNIEWIHYSSIDKYENNFCSVSTTKRLIDSKTKAVLPSTTTPNIYEHIISCTAISVNINPVGLPVEFDDILVECSAYNDNDLIGDQVKIIKKVGNLDLNFEFEEQVSSCLVKIWSKESTGTDFLLWHSEHFDLIRSINVGLVYSSHPENSWFDSLLSGTDGASRKIKTKNSSDRLRSYDKNFALDPWNPVGRASRHLGLKVHPPRSDAFFFVMPGEDDAPRIKAMSDWLKKTILKRRPNTCILFDPYFDTLGIDFLKSVKDMQTNFIVVTNSQLMSFDDEKSLCDFLGDLEKILLTKGYLKLRNGVAIIKASLNRFSSSKIGIESQRSRRIKKYCEANDSLLRKTSLKVYDLVSQNGSAKQYFHDRHLLFFDSDGQLTSGYNFSNSIQGAMKKYPLLITPIPSDIIESLEKHTYEFLSEKINITERRLDLLYSSIEKTERHFVYKKGIDALVSPATFFSILLNKNSVKLFSPANLGTELLKIGFVEGDGSFVEDKIFEYRKNIRSYLEKTPPNFWDVWCDLSEVLARIHDHEIFLSDLAKSPKIVAKIKEILCSADIGDFKQFVTFIEDLDDLEKYIGLHDDNFSTALTKTRNVEYFSLRHNMKIHKYGLDMAISLMRISRELPAVIEQLVSSHPADASKKIIRLRCTEEVCQQLQVRPTIELLEALVRSHIAFLRTVAAHKIYEHRDRDKSLFDLAWIKKHFSSEEIVLVFSEWIYDLRICANQKGGTPSEEDGMLCTRLIQEILSAWSFSEDILKDVLARCGGPHFGSWSLENHNDLCMPLIEANKLTYDDLGGVWLRELLVKIDGVTADKNHFYAPSDSSLTAVASHTFVNLSDLSVRSYFGEIKNLINRCIQQVERPRIKSINFNLWNCNLNALYWLHAFLVYVRSYEKHIPLDVLEEVLKLEKQLQPITLNENAGKNLNSTQEWLLKVKEHIESNKTGESVE